MPPKVKIAKDDIINTALELCRRHGTGAINARSIAAELGCSTQPIFSNFASMDELQNTVILSVYELFNNFLKKEEESQNYPRYKSFGMAYIRFAKEEKELFKLLFMRDRNGEAFVPTSDFDASVEIIMEANGISKEKATLMHMEMWACVHGIAAMFATSFLEFDDDTVSTMLTDVYQGVRARHTLEDNK